MDGQNAQPIEGYKRFLIRKDCPNPEKGLISLWLHGQWKFGFYPVVFYIVVFPALHIPLIGIPFLAGIVLPGIKSFEQWRDARKAAQFARQQQPQTIVINHYYGPDGQEVQGPVVAGPDASQQANTVQQQPETVGQCEDDVVQPPQQTAPRRAAPRRAQPAATNARQRAAAEPRATVRKTGTKTTTVATGQRASAPAAAAPRTARTRAAHTLS